MLQVSQLSEFSLAPLINRCRPGLHCLRPARCE
ncbi:hypothetical protein M495_03815 [Serratia liquefaciens ATCC 27592]|nr:hypothetical protein M495_03815 [Serratia liquefaciens ATCC 27592]